MKVAARFATVSVTVWVIALLAVSYPGPSVRGAAGLPDYTAERAERAKGLTQPYGWFSLVALEWLKPGTLTVGSAKGNHVLLANAPAHLLTLEEKAGKVTVVEAAPSLRLHGEPVTAGMTLSDDERDEAALSSGSLRLWAIARGDRRYLRVKDANAPARVHFRGLNWYAPDAKYRIEAKWVPYPSPHTMRFLNKLGQLEQVDEPGYAEFVLDGKRQTLTPLSASERGLWFVFRDATAPRQTDGGGRFLTTEAPSSGLNKPGSVVLDFNEAVNPPCAYSPYATCPLAAPENRMTVAVPAGEKVYEQD